MIRKPTAGFLYVPGRLIFLSLWLINDEHTVAEDQFTKSLKIFSSISEISWQKQIIQRVYDEKSLHMTQLAA